MSTLRAFTKNEHFRTEFQKQSPFYIYDKYVQTRAEHLNHTWLRPATLSYIRLKTAVIQELINVWIFFSSQTEYFSDIWADCWRAVTNSTIKFPFSTISFLNLLLFIWVLFVDNEMRFFITVWWLICWS